MTNFWYIWSSMFAFQKWSSVAEMRRYLRRFIHLIEGLGQLGGVMQTKYNQYHSVVVPLQRYLQERGVSFHMRMQATDIDFNFSPEAKTASVLYVTDKNGVKKKVNLRDNDYVFITNGSITESTDNGSWEEAPVLKDKSSSGSWMLWEKISKKNKSFGNPGIFSDDIDAQKWYTFTATLKDTTFHDYIYGAVHWQC